jgi:hypothetical protein
MPFHRARPTSDFGLSVKSAGGERRHATGRSLSAQFNTMTHKDTSSNEHSKSPWYIMFGMSKAAKDKLNFDDVGEAVLRFGNSLDPTAVFSGAQHRDRNGTAFLTVKPPDEERILVLIKEDIVK